MRSYWFDYLHGQFDRIDICATEVRLSIKLLRAIEIKKFPTPNECKDLNACSVSIAVHVSLARKWSRVQKATFLRTHIMREKGEVTVFETKQIIVRGSTMAQSNVQP